MTRLMIHIERLRRYIKMHTDIPIELCHSSLRGGAANAWNNIIKRADGDVLVLYDADIIPLPDIVQRNLLQKLMIILAFVPRIQSPSHEEGIVEKAQDAYQLGLRWLGASKCHNIPLWVEHFQFLLC